MEYELVASPRESGSSRSSVDLIENEDHMGIVNEMMTNLIEDQKKWLSLLQDMKK
eukprot:Awhi_evm1s6673